MRLDRHPCCEIAARSKIYETQSVESGGEFNFLNAALRIYWDGSATSLWRCITSIEERMGRPNPPRRGPRTIDIDLLLFGDEIINRPELTVPHPRMNTRTFVLRPLCDVLEGAWLREYSNELN